MEAIIFIGLQASGKSTFYTQRFLNSHARISMDQLKTRNREKRFIELCIDTQMPFVVDNTNPSRADRERYYQLLEGTPFQIVSYYFQSKLEDCLRRNQEREGKAMVAEKGILATYNRMELPSTKEPLQKIYYVRQDAGSFNVEEWNHEV